jgi:hypothetical protein
MHQLLHIALSFPAVLFTILLGIALVYWLFVILGALDIDIFGGAEVDLDGAAEGAGGEGELGAEAGILSALGLRRVPLTVSFSLLALFAWVICVLLAYYLGGMGEALPGWLLGILILVGSFVLAVPLTALACRPLAPLFEIPEAKSRADYVGSVCTVTTGRVDARFGQARIEDNGTVLLVQVRCDRDNAFARNDQALIIEYDEARQAFVIETMDSVLGQTRKR